MKQVRRQLKETLELPTRYAKLYKRAPIKLPSGVMLYGPPGCGKTMLAGAVAAECGLHFISVKGPEILDKYIGGSEQNVRDLFARAAAASPSILFFDEFESIAPRRGADSSGVTDRVVNQLLTFLDGVEDRSEIYVMAASSRPDLIDPALLRPGRLDKPLYCNFPDETERYEIYKSVSNKFEHLDQDVDSCLRDLAKKYSQFTGADIQAIFSSANLATVHDGSSHITSKHLTAAAKATRPSVSPADRAKFLKIFAKFRDEEETKQSGGGGSGGSSGGSSGGGAQQKLTKEQQETLLGKLASFGYDIDEVKQGKQRLATA